MNYFKHIFFLFAFIFIFATFGCNKKDDPVVDPTDTTTDPSDPTVTTDIIIGTWNMTNADNSSTGDVTSDYIGLSITVASDLSYTSTDTNTIPDGSDITSEGTFNSDTTQMFITIQDPDADNSRELIVPDITFTFEK